MIRYLRTLDSGRRCAGGTVVLALAGVCMLSACAGQRAAPDADSPRATGTGNAGVAVMTYRCASGTTLQATYPTDSVALVRYRGTTHELQVARSASGVRYVGHHLQWWTKGTGEGASATLYALDKQGDDEIIERCEQAAR